MDAMIGKWAFIIGLAIAIIAGFVVLPYVTLILVVLGLIVGVLNITDKETKDFLIAAIALTVGATSLNALPAIGAIATTIMANIVAFVVPAALLVALKSVYSLAKAE